MDDDGFPVGSAASPTCNEGHDARSVECVGPGMWDKPFPKCVAGKVKTYFILFLQFKYFLFNNLVSSTNVRTFLKFIVETCPPLNVTNAQFSYNIVRVIGSYLVGTTATDSCYGSEENIYTTSRERTCQPSGNWNGEWHYLHFTDNFSKPEII